MSTVTLTSSLETFSRRFSASAELTQHGKSAVPGGFSRNSFNFGPHAIYVSEGEGAHITTVEGLRLLDLNNNFTVNVLGHKYPEVQQSILSAVESGVSFGNPVSLEIELAELLIERIPSVEKVQFSCSASESCLSAVRLARAHTGREKVAKFEGGYHGFTDALQISWHPDPQGDCGTASSPKPVADSAGIPTADVAQIIVLTQNDWEGTELALRSNAKELACVILELESASGGVVTLEQTYVDRLRDLTAELGIVMIVDETVTLRAGVNGMQADYGLVPDLTVMGKIIGGGFPLGAVGGAKKIMDLLESGVVSISGTHHGHKIALAAGLATMRALTPAAFERLNGMAGRIMTELNDWGTARGSRFSIYGAGTSHLAYGFMREPGMKIKTHRDYWHNFDDDATQTCSLELANRGYFPVARGDFSLSLGMTDDDIGGFIETTKGIVRDIEG